jgi:hypothetical protein
MIHKRVEAVTRKIMDEITFLWFGDETDSASEKVRIYHQTNKQTNKLNKAGKI